MHNQALSVSRCFSPPEFIAMYTYESSEQGDLTFQQGDVILVTKKDGDWWTGTVGDKSGVFPSNYVRLKDSEVNPRLTVSSPFLRGDSLRRGAPVPHGGCLAGFCLNSGMWRPVQHGLYLRTRRVLQGGPWLPASRRALGCGGRVGQGHAGWRGCRGSGLLSLPAWGWPRAGGQQTPVIRLRRPCLGAVGCF